jgi:cytoskeletal protein RodZ
MDVLDSPITLKRVEEHMQFGEGLKQERERRGISLDYIAGSTRISLRHLNALEADRFSELPGGIFNRGIVRSYAQACGLDADGTLQGFVSALQASGLSETQRDDDWIEFAEAVRRNRNAVTHRRDFGWIGVLMMMVAVLIIACGVFLLLLHRGVVHLPPWLHLPGSR